MYRERPSQLDGAFVWTRQSQTDAGQGAVRVLPDGCMDLLFIDGCLQVAGPDTAAWLAPLTTGREYTAAVRLPPGLGGRILGVPAWEIRDQRVPLAEIWPRTEVQRWECLVRAASDPATTLERLLLARSERVILDRWPEFVVGMLRRGGGVGDIAHELGWGPRLLHRRSVEAFGYSPQLLRRILRLQRALDLARACTPLAEAAARSGYSDQAHLAKEARTLGGVPMGQLV